jgi:uncharacterized tellurite resistance protein B-like protein
MGLFDRLTGSGSSTLTSKSALALAALTMIGADGSVEDEEVESLQRIVRGDDEAFRLAFRVYKDKSINECVSLVTNILNDRQKIAAIANLLDIAMADGMLAGAEKRLLEAYVNNFDIEEEIVKAIIEVIAIKNDFSIFE